MAMEDKLLAEEIWAAAGVPTAPYEMRAGGRRRARRGDRPSWPPPLGAVWSGDARDGFNGGGNYVRWVADDGRRRPRPSSSSATRCDRVRVMPFLDGVPCSIHGMVLPDGTAVFRPVEIAIVRDVPGRRFVYGGLSTYWDPAPADREAMRDAARRVGEHLQVGVRLPRRVRHRRRDDRRRLPADRAEHPRVSAGLTTASAVARDLFGLVQTHLLLGLDTGLTVADLESLVPLMDAERVGKPVAVVEGVKVGGPHELLVRYDGERLTRVELDRGDVLALADTPTGFFAKIEPCAALVPGERLAPLNAALLGVPHPRVRRRCPAGRGGSRPALTSRPLGCSPWRGSWWWVVASAGWRRPRASPSSATRSPSSSARRRWVARCRSSPRTGSPGTPGRRRRCCPPSIRDLFRKSGRPVERELDLEPLPEIREHRFEDGSSVQLPGGSRAAQIAALDGLGQGLGQRWVDHVASYADDVGDAAPRLPRGPVGPRPPAPRAGGAAGQPRGAPQAAEEGLQGRAAAADRRAPVRRRGPRPAQRARLARRDGVRRAAVRRVDGARRDGRARGGARGPGWRRAR